MSADNGVYILITKGEDVNQEYRVAHCWAIENITIGPGYPVGADGMVLHEETVVSLFGEARVYTNPDKAEGYADCLYDEYKAEFGDVEHGIKWLNHSTVPFPQRETTPAGR